MNETAPRFQVDDQVVIITCAAYDKAKGRKGKIRSVVPVGGGFEYELAMRGRPASKLPLRFQENELAHQSATPSPAPVAQVVASVPAATS